MIIINRNIPIVFVLFSIISCSKDDQEKTVDLKEETSVKITEEVNESIDSANYYGLSVGNKWVYNSYKLNKETDNYENVSVIDSVSVEAIETIKNEIYFKVKTKTSGNENKITFCNPNGEKTAFLRDSLGYLINSKGEILYNNKKEEQRLISDNHSKFKIYHQQTGNKKTITTNAGDFESLNMEIYAILNESKERSSGMDSDYVAPNIGQVLKTYSFVNSNKPMIEKRLEYYTVK